MTSTLRSESSAQGESPSFLVDRSLGRRYVERLRAEGWLLVTLADIWGEQGAQKIGDIEWIEYSARQGMIALAKDEKVRYYKPEREAIEQNGARIVSYPNANLPVREYVERAQAHRTDIEALLAEPGPFLAKIYSDRVEVTWRPS